MDLTEEIPYLLWENVLSGTDNVPKLTLKQVLSTYQSNVFLREIVLDFLKRNKIDTIEFLFKRLLDFDQYKWEHFYSFPIDDTRGFNVDPGYTGNVYIGEDSESNIRWDEGVQIEQEHMDRLIAEEERLKKNLDKYSNFWITFDVVKQLIEEFQTKIKGFNDRYSQILYRKYLTPLMKAYQLAGIFEAIGKKYSRPKEGWDLAEEWWGIIIEARMKVIPELRQKYKEYFGEKY